MREPAVTLGAAVPRVKPRRRKEVRDPYDGLRPWSAVTHGVGAVLVNVSRRMQGFYVAAGNPKQITGWEDLCREDVCMLNRGCGSASRVLLDEHLRRLGIAPSAVRGYDQETGSHLTLADLAAAAHMSESHFCRSFSAVTHMTPFSYLQQVRIQKSCQYLKNSDLPVSRIALSCGFNDLSYYARRFRERIGCTPSEYRRDAVQEDYSRSGETPSRG